MKHIGFTGTRHGMTDQQMGTVSYVISRIVQTYPNPEPFVAHHGDCVGADAEFHALCEQRTFRMVGHPSTHHLRAFCRFDEERERLPPMKRNAIIVAESDVMIAGPREMEEQERGGTWGTYRIARRAKKPLVIVWPDGRTTYERWP